MAHICDIFKSHCSNNISVLLLNKQIKESRYKMKFKTIIGQNSKIIEKKDLKDQLQKDLGSKTHLNIFLGSGCSTKAISLMGKTFKDFRDNADSNFNQCYQNFIDKHPEDKDNIESFLSWINSGILYSGSKELLDIKSHLTDFLVASVREPFNDYGFINEKSEDIKITRQNYHQFIERLAAFKSASNDRFDIINLFTTNYDLFIENTLDDLKYDYSDGFSQGLNYKFDVSEYSKRPVDTHHRFKDHWSTISPFFRVYKLHGSINWIAHRDEEKRIYIIKTPMLNQQHEALIAPTSSKYAETQGSPYSDLFRELSIQLLIPDSILLLNGFSFGDEHINDLILQALSRSDFKLIAFIDENNKATKTFINKVGGNNGAIFITDGEKEEKEHAYYFSTLVDLMKIEDDQE